MKHILVGLIALFLGIWGIIAWWSVFGLILRGILPFALVVFGLIALLSGLRRFSGGPVDKTTVSAESEGQRQPD